MDEVCYRTRHLDLSWTLSVYEGIGGYSAWRKILKEKTPRSHILEQIKQSGLRGRGGGGFSTAMKWGFIRPETPGQKYLICNSDESEPGTCKDHEIMMTNPHQILEGMAIAAYTMGATVGYHYLRGEAWDCFQRCEQALKEAYAAGLLGKDIQGSGIDVDIHHYLGAGAYICGEETALMESIEGKKGLPRFKPPFPANYGLYGKPTTINNTETLASVPVILEKGADWFLSRGTPKSGGTKIFSVSGHVNKPGNYEIGLGTPFSELLSLAGGMRGGAKIKAVIPGGSSMPVVPGSVMMETRMDYESIVAVGSMLGSGAVIVMDEQTCMVKALLRIAEFYQEESCGQCTPCREGSGWLARMVHKIAHGQGEMGDIERLKSIAQNIEGRTICAFGEATAWPVLGFIRHFYDEFAHHIQHKRCMVDPS